MHMGTHMHTHSYTHLWPLTHSPTHARTHSWTHTDALKVVTTYVHLELRVKAEETLDGLQVEQGCVSAAVSPWLTWVQLKLSRSWYQVLGSARGPEGTKAGEEQPVRQGDTDWQVDQDPHLPMLSEPVSPSVMTPSLCLFPFRDAKTIQPRFHLTSPWAPPHRTEILNSLWLDWTSGALTLLRPSRSLANPLVVQSLSRESRTEACQASLSSTISRSLLKLTSIELVMPSNHLILCRPLLLPSNFPSIRIFSNESALHIRWPKYWSFSFSISPSNEYSRLISFRIDWFDLLAVQGLLRVSPAPCQCP